MLNGAELMTENGALRFVVGLKALASGYDANGNMTLRLKDGVRYFLAYDAENRLTSVSGTVSASFVYNGDGQRVSATNDTTITTYIGGYFEWQAGAGKSYYFAGAQRIAMRASAGVEFLLGDHLGSTSLTVDSLGGNPRELRYYPWGEVRWASRTTPTDYRFTGQMEVGYINLYWYGSRWYDPYIPRLRSTPGGGFVSGVTGGGAIQDGDLDVFVGTGYKAVVTARRQYGLTNPVGPENRHFVYRVICPNQKEGAL